MAQQPHGSASRWTPNRGRNPVSRLVHGCLRYSYFQYEFNIFFPQISFAPGLHGTLNPDLGQIMASVPVMQRTACAREINKYQQDSIEFGELTDHHDRFRYYHWKGVMRDRPPVSVNWERAALETGNQFGQAVRGDYPIVFTRYVGFSFRQHPTSDVLTYGRTGGSATRLTRCVLVVGCPLRRMRPSGITCGCGSESPRFHFD